MLPFPFLHILVYRDSYLKSGSEKLTPSGFSFCQSRSTDPKSSSLLYHKNRVLLGKLCTRDHLKDIGMHRGIRLKCFVRK
jgi:hypothetical protein